MSHRMCPDHGLKPAEVSCCDVCGRRLYLIKKQTDKNISCPDCKNDVISEDQRHCTFCRYPLFKLRAE